MVTVNFNTLFYPFLGGLFVSAATTLSVWLKGRYVNFGDAFHSVVTFNKDAWGYKASLLAGAIIATVLTWDIYGFQPQGGVGLFDLPQQFVAILSIFGWIISGLLIGFGGRLIGSGLDAHIWNHVPRASKRSLVIVGAALGTAVLVATLKYQFPFFDSTFMLDTAINAPIQIIANVWGGLAVGLVIYSIVQNDLGTLGLIDIVINFVVGFLFAVGLLIAGGARRFTYVGFLSLGEDWNPQILVFFLTVVLVNWLTFYFVLQSTTPKLALTFDKPQDDSDVNLKAILGAVALGAGFGLSGIWTITAIFDAGFYFPHLLAFFLAPFLLGRWLGGFVEGKSDGYEIIKSN